MALKKLEQQKVETGIIVSGCDASTEVVMELSMLEWDFLTRLVETVNAKAEFGCQPTMEASVEKGYIERIREDEDYY